MGSDGRYAERQPDYPFRTSHTLAVYGTLAPGQPNHHVVALPLEALLRRGCPGAVRPQVRVRWSSRAVRRLKEFLFSSRVPESLVLVSWYSRITS
jgi:hypothetical protein